MNTNEAHRPFFPYSPDDDRFDGPHRQLGWCRDCNQDTDTIGCPACGDDACRRCLAGRHPRFRHDCQGDAGDRCPCCSLFTACDCVRVQREAICADAGYISTGMYCETHRRGEEDEVAP